MTKDSKKIITHNGTYHTDDIFACATVSLVLEKKGEEFEIIRSRDEKIIAEGDFVLDIGSLYEPEKNKFDHHQIGGAGKRANGIDYATFGLVWKKFGLELAESEKVVLEVDQTLVAPIDAHDNGINLVEKKSSVSPFLIQDFFFLMSPTWKEDESDRDPIFLKAVELAKAILLRSITHAKDAIEGKEKVKLLYDDGPDKRIIVLDKHYPFETTLESFPEPLYAVYPRESDGFWTVKAIRKDLKGFENRKNLPVAWTGLRDQELQKATGVPDAVFCHRALFMAVAKSKEGAVKLAQIAVES